LKSEVQEKKLLKSEKVEKAFEIVSEKIDKFKEFVSETVDKVVEVAKEFPIPRKYPISVVSGVFILVVFWGLTFTAIFHFPFYNPLVNWMSDLGSSKLNPKGAIFFNIGCIITGIAFFPFFLGLYEWYIGGKRNRRLTILTQISGFYCGFSMIMIGIFPEDYLVVHIFWAINLFTVSVLTFIFPSIALYRFKITRSVAKFGFISAVINFILWLFIIPIMEWATIILSFTFIMVIIISMQRRIDKLRFVRKQHIEIPKKRKKSKKK